MPPKRAKSKEAKTPRKENELWFSRAQRAFKLGGILMRGANNALYKSVIIKATPDDKKKFRQTFHKQEPPLATTSLCESQSGHSMTKYQKSLRGQKKGKSVHSNVQKIVDRALAKKSGKNISAREPKVHPQCEMVFRVMDKVGVDMQRSELGVFWKSARTATRIDFTGMHRATKCRIIGELKTGYRGSGYTMPAFRLRYQPYTLLSLRDTHFLQLLVSVILHKHTFPKIPMGDAVLVHTPDNLTAKCLRMPNYITDMTTAVESALERR